MTDTVEATDRLTLRGLSRSLKTVADGLTVDITDPQVTADQLLEHLRALAVVFGATDAGNATSGKDPGPLRPHRTAVFHALADRGVTRQQIADAAGVTVNAIGFAFRGTRKQRRATIDPAPINDGASPGRKRKQRPGS